MTATTTRFAAFVFAAAVTLTMLAGIGALADGQVAQAQIAATAAGTVKA